jgi:hypothetical protein
MCEQQPIEISTICSELEKLSHSGVFLPMTANACAQAADLLMKMRELIITAPGTASPEGDALAQLKWLLTLQGEG